MKRYVLKELSEFFGKEYKSLPYFLRVIPAIIFYFLYYKDIFGINFLISKINYRNKTQKINSKIVFFEDESNHVFLARKVAVEGSQLIIKPNKIYRRYRSDFICFILEHDFNDCDIIHIGTIENLHLSKEKYLKQFKKLPQYKVVTAHLFISDNEVKYLSQYFDMVLTLTEWQAEHLRSLGISNVDYIHHPVLTSNIKTPDKTFSRKKYNIPEDKIVLSFAGNIRKQKGIFLVINAIKKLEPEYQSKFFLNISGNTSFLDKEKLIKSISELNISKRIDVRSDYMPFEELVENMVLSDYFLLPYHYSFKNISAQLIELAHHGVKCIGTDSSIISAMIDTYGLGLTFKSNDLDSFNDLLRNIADDKVSTKIPKRDFDKDYDFDDIINKYKMIYKLNN